MLAHPAGTKAQTTPLQFNDKIAYITDSLFKKGQQWGTKFNEAYQAKNFASLKPTREAMERYITAKITEVQNMKDVKNSKNLRMAMVSFLKFEKDMITRSFIPVESLKSTATENEVKAALDKMTEFSTQEAGELKKVSDAQEAYAKANGFTIAPPPKEEAPGK